MQNNSKKYAPTVCHCPHKPSEVDPDAKREDAEVTEKAFYRTAPMPSPDPD
jgi:hypothetical protein